MASASTPSPKKPPPITAKFLPRASTLFPEPGAFDSTPHTSTLFGNEPCRFTPNQSGNHYDLLGVPGTVGRQTHPHFQDTGRVTFCDRRELDKSGDHVYVNSMGCPAAERAELLRAIENGFNLPTIASNVNAFHIGSSSSMKTRASNSEVEGLRRRVEGVPGESRKDSFLLEEGHILEMQSKMEEYNRTGELSFEFTDTNGKARVEELGTFADSRNFDMWFAQYGYGKKPDRSDTFHERAEAADAEADSQESVWTKNLQTLVAWMESHGGNHPRVGSNHPRVGHEIHPRVGEDIRNKGLEELEIGSWLKLQRKTYKGKYGHRRYKLMDSYGIDMDPDGNKFDESFKELLEYRAKYGATPRNNTCEASKLGKSGARLGKWFRSQRTMLSGKYNDEKYKLFDYHGFDLDPIGNKWTEHFLELGEYYSQNRELPARGTRLGDWAYTQKKQPTLTEMKKREAGELVMFGRINWDRHHSDLEARNVTRAAAKAADKA